MSSDLQNMPVMLSASIPDELRHTLRAQDLFTAITVFIQSLISAGGRIVFGGHPDITPLMRQAALSTGMNGVVELFQLRRFSAEAPQDIYDKTVFPAIHWIGSKDGSTPIEEELQEMRQNMAQMSSAAIFIGGKTSDYQGKKAGIREEHEIFLQQYPSGPVYLIGLLAGETLNIIHDAEKNQALEPNKMSARERRLIHYSDNIDVIAPLVLADITRHVSSGSP